MKINKTTEYFNMSIKEAAKMVDEYITKEEAKVLDEGLEHYFFGTYEGLVKEFESEERKNYTEKYDYEVLLFEFVCDNSNHNKYCMVFV